MKTGSWQTYTGPGRIGISIGAPRGAPAGYRRYSPLYPRREMLSWSKPRYEAAYREILAKLDPAAVVREIEALAGPGVEPVLMCFEKPPFDEHKNWCHRHMVRDWFKETLGIEVGEINPMTSIGMDVGKTPAVTAQRSLKF